MRYAAREVVALPVKHGSLNILSFGRETRPHELDRSNNTCEPLFDQHDRFTTEVERNVILNAIKKKVKFSQRKKIHQDKDPYQDTSYRRSALPPRIGVAKRLLELAESSAIEEIQFHFDEVLIPRGYCVEIQIGAQKCAL